VRVARAGAQVAVDRACGLRSERTRPRSSTLAEHDCDVVVVDVDVGDVEAGELTHAHPGVDEQAQDRLIAQVVELA
jgi:hypothetical protein